MAATSQSRPIVASFVRAVRDVALVLSANALQTAIASSLQPMHDGLSAACMCAGMEIATMRNNGHCRDFRLDVRIDVGDALPL